MAPRDALQPLRNGRSWKDQAEELLVEVRALYLASRDPRTPFLARLVAVFVASYLASPIQLIPNWIPVVGYLDDLLVSLAGLWLMRRLIPPEQTEEFLALARETDAGPDLFPHVALALAVVGLCGLLIALIVRGVVHFVRG